MESSILPMTYFRLPEGFRAVPLGEVPSPWAWPLCVVVSEIGGFPAFEVLRVNPDGRAVLGCVTDQGDYVRLWLEIWVQDLEGHSDPYGATEGSVSSLQLDAQWQRRWAATQLQLRDVVLLQVDGDSTMPTYVDARKFALIQPKAPSGESWRLCRQDKYLEAAGLPLYSRSVRRYLFAGAEGKQGISWLAADRDSPRTSAVLEREIASGIDPDWLPLNPQGAPMVAALHAPLNFRDYFELLNGASPLEVASKKGGLLRQVILNVLGTGDRDSRRNALLVTGGPGQPGAAMEVFHLKVRLFRDAIAAVAGYLTSENCPLLNLEPESLAVHSVPVDGVPWAWSARCRLARAGRALKVPIPGTERVQYLSTSEIGPSVYCPSGLMVRPDTTATIRLRRVIDTSKTKVTLEGTLQHRFQLHLEDSDLVRFRLPNDRIAGEFYGEAKSEKDRRRGELAFVTFPRELDPSQIAELKRWEGARIDRCWCEFIPVMSSPYDFYSLYVLGAESLLAGEHNPLVDVLDALERLAGMLAPPIRGSTDFAHVVRGIKDVLDRGDLDPALGTHQLLGGRGKSTEAPVVPETLWCETLAVLLRLATGIAGVSLCEDYGAVVPGGLADPLAEPLEVLESLASRSRGLLFQEWSINAEVRAVFAELKNEL